MEARSAKRRRQVDLLYELWDVNASGYLELEEIQVVLNKWRSDGIEKFKEGSYDCMIQPRNSLLNFIRCIYMYVRQVLLGYDGVTVAIINDDDNDDDDHSDNDDDG